MTGPTNNEIGGALNTDVTVTINSVDGATGSNVDTLFLEDPVGTQTTPAPVRSATISRPCRYFAQGYCAAGAGCEFTHSEHAPASHRPLLCQFFARGSCRDGPNCRFSHAQPSTSLQQSSVPVCKFFQSLRGCKNAACEFRHEQPSSVHVPPVMESVDPGQASKILEKYSALKIAESKGQATEFRPKY